MKKSQKVVIATGGFDPVHSGHIRYLNSAKLLGEKLVVGLNSDSWLQRKKGKEFMPMEERSAIVSNLKCVDDVITFDDSDDTAMDAIKQVRNRYPEAHLVFANGGDRNSGNIPERSLKDTGSIEFHFGVGGDDKANSSSWILSSWGDWKDEKWPRAWGHYRVLYEVDSKTKVKELTVYPGRKLSLQKHFHRHEYWMCIEGTATVYTGYEPSNLKMKQLDAHEEITIPLGYWHRLENNTDQNVKIIEIQYGTQCVESDISRL